ncbi:MAG: sulfur carrier protein ThiS [Proteobacteria bacterium]|nr:sulfur carrier protein ThiS [Pseudomonadota bacterium]MBU1581771.1 sulfur carrier protein ThiS [Pseudomonadota bacterium]MBU2453274.1 sulfur carrier protein ThiS [Pseudomonadota bacterium]MBU2630596.1 sulfur carrier protein ThiS [Pseudomonadota bacterium]
MNIRLNGKQVASKSRTLMDLVLEKGFDPDALIAEVNFKVIRQEIWKEVAIREGDIIELLSFVGGG